MGSELLKIVRQIEAQYPLSGINEEDGRYAWSDRWNALLMEAYAQEEADAQREEGDDIEQDVHVDMQPNHSYPVKIKITSVKMAEPKVYNPIDGEWDEVRDE